MIVRLNGGADELSGRERDTYVVSEDDYIDYLSQSKVSELLPVGLAARLRRSHLLFVGYDLDDWSPRVFLRRLGGGTHLLQVLGDCGAAEPPGWSSGVSSGSTRSRPLGRVAGGAASARRKRARRRSSFVSARTPPAAAQSTRPASPYKGLAAFDDSEVDEQLFFGREHERDVIAANVVASRLTVLYGPSGVGKSSIVRAAVARDLRALAGDSLVVVCDGWAGQPATTLAEAVASAAPIDAGPLADTIEVAVAEHCEAICCSIR